MTTKIFVNNLERKLFFLLAGFLGVALAVYFSAMISLTISAVSRDRLLGRMREDHAMVSAQEQEYIRLQNDITLERARELGFTEVSMKFAQREAHISANKLSFAR